MTPQEINEAVAKRLGWTVLEANVPMLYERNEHCVKANGLPDYSGSIQAAWELWDRLNEMATLTKHNGIWFLDYGRRFVVKADTASEVLCLAFLKLEDK